MKKLILFLSVSFFVLVIGFFIGRKISTSNKQDDTVIARNTVNNTITNKQEKGKDKEILTSLSEEKISINTQIIEETYYSKCDHKVENIIKDTKKYINMTKDMLQKEFPTWEIKEFEKDKVVLYKEEEDFCNEHFLIKDEDGYITIYTIDNDKNILELLDKTDIATKYLTNVDQDNLKNGMIIYTKQNLNKLIEDFE